MYASMLLLASFFFFFIVESWLAMEMIGQQVFVTKCWRLISAWIAVTARLQHSQQGGNTGRKHGNQDDVDSSRYNQARFLFAFAFKWFHVCYAKCYAEGTRVKSNRCTTQTCIFIQHNGCFVSRIFLSFLLSFSSIFFYLSFFFFRSPYFSLRARELVEHDVLFENLPLWKIVVVGGGWGNSEE